MQEVSDFQGASRRTGNGDDTVAWQSVGSKGGCSASSYLPS